jgi:hypothetical protein
MREKLRNYFRGKSAKSADAVINAFAKEAQALSEDLSLPKPLEFYISLMKSAVEYVRLSPQNLDTLNSEYVTFLEALIKYH